MDEIKSKLRHIYVKALRLSIDPSAVGDHNLIRELGIDSIMSLEILVWVESEFHIMIEDSDLSPKLIDSLDTLASYIAERSGSPTVA
jgi:2-polyprenyl-3-methyl-5-hydroxy-6-metoxy-1,4-benzoquinol methylase